VRSSFDLPSSTSVSDSETCFSECSSSDGMYDEASSIDMGNSVKVCPCIHNMYENPQQKVEKTVPTFLMYLQAYFVIFMTVSKLLNEKIDNFSQHCSSAPFSDSLSPSSFPFPVSKPLPSTSSDPEKDSPDFVVLMRRTKGLAKMWALWLDETLWGKVYLVKDSTLVVTRNLVSKKFWEKFKTKLGEIPLFENNL
jgi:hypothetical protein